MNSDDDSVDVEDSGVLTKMCRIDIIYNSGQVLCSGWGNTRKAAERNASILGLDWLHASSH